VVGCAAVADGGAELTVEDDGPGVPAEDRERIFTPFFTTRSDGTGLGLATVQRIVDAHGGGVTVEAAVPHGALFRVRLPPPSAAEPG
jgi:two-component system sensor histidine kinase PilS (NtrC family)